MTKPSHKFHKAKSCKKTIVLPESEDIRTYEAAEAILKDAMKNGKIKNIAKIIRG